MKISVLGSGTSHGIPVVGCPCPVCTSADSRDKRMRSSLFIEGSSREAALIDAGPEFRLQAVRAGITRLDAIFLTHSHADHIHGLDDVRPLSRDNPIPVYGNEETITEMEERFSYIWKETQKGGGKPKLKPIVTDREIRLGSLTFTPIPVKHGALDIYGWEIRENYTHENSPPENTGKSLIYLTDTSAVPPASLKQLARNQNFRQYRIIIIGGLRTRPHATHFTFEEALKTALSIGAEEIYLTHICHEHSHAEIEEICQKFDESRPNRTWQMENRQISTRRKEEVKIHPAWDGLELVI